MWLKLLFCGKLFSQEFFRALHFDVATSSKCCVWNKLQQDEFTELLLTCNTSLVKSLSNTIFHLQKNVSFFTLSLCLWMTPGQQFDTHAHKSADFLFHQQMSAVLYINK